MSHTSRPPTPGQDAIPELLRSLPRWLRWQLQKNYAGKQTKVPDRSTRSGDLLSYSAAIQQGPCNQITGIGFVFTGGVDIPGRGRLFALDLDGCRDPDTGAVEEWAREIVLNFGNTYTEITPSRMGLRVWFVVQNPPEFLTRAKIKLDYPHAPGVPDSKSVEIQIFGYGVPQYVTVTGWQLAGTDAELAVVRDLSWLFERYDMAGGELTPDAKLPVGAGKPPASTTIEQRVRRSTAATAVLEADWQPLVSHAEDRDSSASAAFFKVAQHVLRAASGHGKAALDFLLSTAWGDGDVVDSADPSKYGRAAWVTKELIRVASKAPVPSAKVFDDNFDPSTFTPPEAHTEPRSAIHRLWPTDRSRWFDTRPPDRVYLLEHPDGDGMLPLGKAATFSAEGGAGKTNMIVQLGVAVATGSDWLGYYRVRQGNPRRVLLLLGEEDVEEVHRKLYYACAAMNLTRAQRDIVEQNIVPMPLAGEVTALLRNTNDGNVESTEHSQAIRERLAATAGDGWGLIVIDPQSRFAGVNVEADNAVATRFVQECETFCTAPGTPTVMVVAHSSKMARRAGSADSRGVTGLTDGFRWHATLVAQGKQRAVFNIQKNNLGRPSDAINLVRSAGGLLFAETATDRLEREQEVEAKAGEKDAKVADKHTALVALAVERAERQPGLSRNELAGVLDARRTEALRAVDAAAGSGLLEKVTQGRNVRYFVNQLLK